MIEDRISLKQKADLYLDNYIKENEKRKALEKKLADLSFKYNFLNKQYHELNQISDFNRSVVKNISSGIIAIDKSAKIVFINRAALADTGYNYDQVKDQSLEMLFADKEEARLIIQNIIKNKQMYTSRETHFLRADKTPISIGFSTTELQTSDSDEFQGVIFIFRNIGMVNKSRKLMERMDRLATLGELAAGVAHEIRNPLAGIKSSVQVLEETLSPGDYRSELIKRIVKEIDRSNDLLKRFFNFAKPNKPKYGQFSIEKIIDGIYLLLASRLKKRRIEFTKINSSKLPQVYCDEGQIEQVILNIILNAVDALNNEGQIIVESGFIDKICLDEKKGEATAVFIKISDNGVGIAQDEIEKIFNPFYTTKPEGVGLGLSISNRLLEENGGKIEVSSEQGKGSTFKIYLPIADHK